MSAEFVMSVSMTDETPVAAHFHRLMVVLLSPKAADRLDVKPVKPLANPIVAGICCPEAFSDVNGSPPIDIAPADVPRLDIDTMP